MRRGKQRREKMKKALVFIIAAMMLIPAGSTAGLSNVFATDNAVQEEAGEEAKAEAANEATPEQEEEAVPLKTLRAATNENIEARNTTEYSPIYQYSAETVSYKLNNTEVSFAGGSLAVKDGSAPDGVPGYDPAEGEADRTFAFAGFVYGNEGDDGTLTFDTDTPVQITGLYIYEDKWYYTTENSQSSEGISVGYVLPENVQVRFYYSPAAGQEHAVNGPEYKEGQIINTGQEIANTAAVTDEDKKGLWNYSIDIDNGNAMYGDIVTIETALPSHYAYGYVEIKGNTFSSTFALERVKDSSDENEVPPAGTYDAKAVNEGNNDTRYTSTFVMPDEAVTVTVTGAKWNLSTTRFFGVFANEGSNNDSGMRGITRIYTLKTGSIETNNITYLSTGETNETAFGEQYDSWSLGRYYKQDGDYDQNGSSGKGTTIDKGGAAPYYAIENYHSSTSDSNSRGQRIAMMSANYTDVSKIREAVRVDLGNFLNVTGTLTGPGTGNSLNITKSSSDTYQANIPHGSFIPGEDVVLQIETNRANVSSGYSYLPESIWLDVYKGSGQYKETANYVREVYALPQQINQTKTYTHPMGAKVTIKCVAYKSTDYTSPRDGKNLSNVYSNNNYGAKSGVYAYQVTISGCNQAFKVIYNSYQTSQGHFHTTQMDGIVQGIGSTPDNNSPKETGSYVQVNKDGSADKSKEYYPLGLGFCFWSKQAANMDNGGDGEVLFGIQPEEGYSMPTAELEHAYNGDSITLKRDTDGKAILDDQGRYQYILKVNRNTSGNLPTDIKFKAEPVEFAMKYWGFDESDNTEYVDSGNVLSHAGQTKYTVGHYVPQLEGGKFFAGYKLEIRPTNADGTTGDTFYTMGKDYSDFDQNSPSYFMAGDVIDVHQLYEAFEKSGMMKEGVTDYTVALVPVTSDSSASEVMAHYTVYKQESSLYSSSDIIKDEDGKRQSYRNDKFVAETTNINVPSGGSVVLRGYQSEMSDETGTYVLDEETKIDTATNVQENQSIGQFYYFRTAGAQILLPDELMEQTEELSELRDKVTSWNNSQREGNSANGDVIRKYTAVIGNDTTTINIDKAVGFPKRVFLNNGNECWTLEGYKILRDYDLLPKSESDSNPTYAEIAEDDATYDRIYNTSLNDDMLYFYELDNNAYQDIWGSSTRAGKGTIYIIPIYEYKYGPIQSVDNPEAHVTTYTDEGFTLKAYFKYEGEFEYVRDTALNVLIRRPTIDSIYGDSFGAQGYHRGGPLLSGGWWGKIGDGINTDGFIVEKEEEYEGGGILSVTVQRLNVPDGKFDRIRYAADDKDGTYQPRYVILAWTPANGIADDNAGITPQANEIDQVGSFSTYVDVLPKKVTSDTADGGAADTGFTGVEGIYHRTLPEMAASSDSDLTITEDFIVDSEWYCDKFYFPNRPDGVTVAESDKTEETNLKAALFRRPSVENGKTNNNPWELWADENGATGEGIDKTGSEEINKVKGKPTITVGNDGVAKVSFTIDANYVGDENFEYCVALWNGRNIGDIANEEITTSAEDFKPSDDNGTAESPSTYAKIPSVTRQIKPGWDSPDQYVIVPQRIILTEDNLNPSGQEDNGDGYDVGNGGEITYVDTSAEGSPDILPDIVICAARHFNIQNADHTSIIRVDAFKGNGTDVDPDVHGKDDHWTIGTLKQDETESLTYWLRAKLPQGLKSGDQHWGIMTYHFNEDDHGGTSAGGN